MLPNPDRRLFKTWEVTGLVFLVGSVCAGLSGLAIKTDLRSAHEIFTQQAYTFQREVAHRFASADAVLTTLVGLHHASDNVKSYEFAGMSRELLQSYPHIRTIAKLTAVREDEREVLEESMQASGFPQFQLTERTQGGTFVRARDRGVAMPITSMEPFNPEFAQLIGYDTLTDPILSEAIFRAIDTGAVIESDVVTIPNVGRGFFAFKAIYFGYDTPTTAESRREQVSGIVALFLDSQRFFDVTDHQIDGFSVYGRDERDVKGKDDTLIYQETGNTSDSGFSTFDPFVIRLELPAQGRTFVLEMLGRPGLDVIRGWFVGIFVALPAVAGTFLILALANHRRRQRQAREDETKLRRNEERFRDFAEIASDWFWATDERLRFSYVSDQLIAATGMKPYEIIGKSRNDLVQFAAEDRPWQQHLTDLAMRRSFRGFRYEYVDDQGRSLWLSISGKPVFDDDGEFLGYRGTGTNVTAEVEAQTALRQAKEEAELASRSKSTFLANMSHELRTPLNAIIGFSDLMKRGVSGVIENERHQEYVRDIHGAGEHLLLIINEILDLAKVEAGNSPLQEDSVDVLEVVESIRSLIIERANENQIVLKFKVPDDLPLLRADTRKLKQILVNLLSNAVKFTPARGLVTLEVACDRNRGYRFRVEDTGIGIAEEDIPNALAAFQQIDSELNRKYEGTGLGLPLAKAFVEQHGGSLTLQSIVGQGTLATICFPPSRIVPRDTVMPVPESARAKAKAQGRTRSDTQGQLAG